MINSQNDCFHRQCIHFRGWRQERPSRSAPPVLITVCEAFPGGIPDDISSGRDPHTSSRPGDNGIVYERADDAEWNRILDRL